MSWDSEDEMMDPPAPNQEERVLDCFERSASEWLRGKNLKSWAGCDQAVLDDLVDLGKLETGYEVELGRQYRLAAPEPPAPRRRMKFAVGHPNDIAKANLDVLGWPLMCTFEHCSYEEVVEWVEKDAAVLVMTQDPRPLDAMAPDDWRDLKARLVLVRRDGVIGALTGQEARDVMEDYRNGHQNLSEIIRQRVVLD